MGETLHRRNGSQCKGPSPPSTDAVSRTSAFMPQSQMTAATSMAVETVRKLRFQEPWSFIQPMSEGEAASPKRWMTNILSAKAVARMEGGVTFASAVLEGPVLKNRKKIATKMQTHAAGNGT